ncbi:MAG: benzoate-CoA ligase family protein [Actinomycetota bacterium]|jgi:benzoate-CoA ligase family protein|nr:benzoate-CoA ligase family protein [Actinomycetota bacterium]
MSEHFNAAHYFVDRHVEDGDGDRTAVRSMGQELTYRDLQQLSSALAAGLDALDVRQGERVLFVCSDRPELLVGLLGCWRHGAVAVPVSTMLTGPELAKVVADSGARMLVVSPEFAEAAQVAAEEAPQLAHLVAIDEAALSATGSASLTSWDEVLDAGSWQAGTVVPPARTYADSPALWLYTSGTTGTPKGAMHRHENLRAVCETYARDVLRITRDDVCFSIAKLFFAYGLGNAALFPLAVGATTVLEPRRPSPDVVVQRMREDAPTLFFAGPTFFAALLAAELPEDTFRSVRLCASAGEALPAALYTRFTTRFGVEILDGIGSTEALHIFLSNKEGEVRPGTSGTPVPGYDIDLRDENGATVPDDTPGALFVRGASLASGYWCRTEATREVFQGEWLRTGDTYTRSADGYYTCLGRSNDLLKAGGIWVSPAELEDRLLQHPDVVEAAVVGVPDSNELDKPVACVVLAPGASVDADGLVQWCREGLAAFKRPRAVLVVDELPKTATGKIQRFKLRSMAQDRVPPVPAGRSSSEAPAVPVTA